MPLKSDDVIRFLVAHIKDPHCEVCGVNKWIVPTPEEQANFKLGVPIARLDGTFGLPSPLEMFVYVFCDNCGNSRFHHFKKIEDWAEKNPASVTEKDK